MTLLRNGVWTDNDAWTPVESHDESGSLSTHQHAQILLTIDQFQSLSREEKTRAPGVVLNPADDVQVIKEHLSTLQLVAINFPKYTDGRGYSQARVLRTQLNFPGEIRALGDVRPDQILFMMRAGITTFQFETQPNQQVVQQILTRFKANYQPSYPLPIAG
ncbi:MAG: DUF934 domain-containing protein [Granulosicoccus sp.]